jgi:hypothetical protein
VCAPCAGSTCSTGGQAAAGALRHLLARHPATQPLGLNRDAFTEIRERVSGDDRPPAFDPEHEIVVLSPGERLDSEGQPVVGRVPMRFGTPGSQPSQVGAPVPRLLGRDPVLLHQVLGTVGRRCVHRRVQARDEVARVAFVPRRGEHDHGFALRSQGDDLAWDGERVEEEHARSVVDRVRRDLLRPGLAWRPVGMC